MPRFALWRLLAPPAPPASEWVGFDAVARAVLPAVSLLFLVCSFYAVAYLRLRAERPNRMLYGALLVLLGLMSLALQARHLGVLWIAIEGATLATVPLLHFNGTARAFEATWKYLLVGGTGIALSLLGSFCLGYASLHGGGSGDLTFAGLTAQGSALSRPWLVTAWVLVAGGLRHEDGPGADAHLETRRLRRGAGYGWRPAGGRDDHDGLRGAAARPAGGGRRRRWAR